jgi:hypothetical protein
MDRTTQAADRTATGQKRQPRVRPAHHDRLEHPLRKRRFDAAAIFRLQNVFNAARLKVWRQQPKSFFEQAILDADGTMAETTGECKEGYALAGDLPENAWKTLIRRTKCEVKTKPRRRPENVKQRSVANPLDGAADRLSAVGAESLAARLLPFARPTSRTAALLKQPS